MISNRVSIPEDDIEMHAIRAQGSGGQHVNKVSTAIHLRFDISASCLPDHYKEKLLAWSDQRISEDGVIVIKAQNFRSQEKNRADALERLRALILHVMQPRKHRKATKPTFGSKRRRLDSKKKRGQVKVNRGRVDY